MKRVRVTLYCPVLPARAIPLLSLARATRADVRAALDGYSPGWKRNRNLRIARLLISEPAPKS